MSPYNILSDIKSGRIQVKSMDSATILFFKCQRWDIIYHCSCNVNSFFLFFFHLSNYSQPIRKTTLSGRVFDTCSTLNSLQAAEMRYFFVKFS